jgi:DNA-binding NarL/FixJ family response regulator
MDKPWEVVGGGANGIEAIELAERVRPDIVLMDVAMPDMNGIEAARRILDTHPDTRIIAISMHAERSFIAGMLQAGAMGYIRKESAFEEISTAIETVSAGRVFLGDGIAKIVAADGAANGPGAVLTRRETEVLGLIADGMKTREIADALHLSDKTIESHRRSISRKLDLYSVAELTKYAIRAGLTSVE